MENNFIQMAASAGHAVAYTIGPIFKHIIDWSLPLDQNLHQTVTRDLNSKYSKQNYHQKYELNWTESAIEWMNGTRKYY